MFFDTHCHLNFSDYDSDYQEVITRALEAGVFMVLVGSDFSSSERGVHLAQNFPKGVYASIGLHPNGVLEEDFSEDKFQAIIDNNDRVVAIGETGLDYYRSDLTKSKQQEVFYQHLNLAYKNNLPVIIHCREAHNDLYDILKKFKEEKNPLNDWGVIHCFSGNYQEAQNYIDLGLKISFTGLITFASNWDELIKKISLEHLMIETDSPYLSPLPYRGQRNEPLRVIEVAKKIAELKSLDLKLVADVLWKNSLKFFKI